MEKLEKDYSAFERIMDEEEIYRDESLTFEEVCRRIGADPFELGNLIRDELGFSGPALMEAYRFQMRIQE